MADHTGADRTPWCAHLVKKFTVRRLGYSPKHFVTNACRMFADRFEFDSEFLLCVIVLELGLDPGA